MKRLLTLFALMLVCIGQTFAYDFEVNGIYYNKSGSNATVTYATSSYNSYSGSVYIPPYVTYKNVRYDVTSIGSYAFFNCSGLTFVTIPYSVTSIGEKAFYGCTGLDTVTNFSPTPQTISGDVFSNYGTLLVPLSGNFEAADNWNNFTIEDYLGEALYRAYEDILGSVDFNPKNYRVGSDPGEYSQKAVDNMTDAWAIFSELFNYGGGDYEEYNRAIAQLQEAYWALLASKVSINDGQYYRIWNWRDNGTYDGCLYEENSQIKWTANYTAPEVLDIKGTHYIWKFVKIDGKNYFQNYYTGRYMSDQGDFSGAFPSTAEPVTSFSIEESDELGSFNIRGDERNTGWGMHAQVDDYVAVYWNAGSSTNNQGSLWRFETVNSAEVEKYLSGIASVRVTVASSDESKGSVSGGGTVAYGDEVTLTATPAAGCEFARWSNGSTENPYTFTPTEDMTLTAIFQPIYITATSSDESKGTVFGGGTYAVGATATLTATPAVDCKFLRWSNGTTANPYTFIVTKDTTLTAIFREEQYDITAANAGTPMTYDEFIALAGTGKHFGLMAVSASNETYHKWFGFTSATSRVNALTYQQLFTLTGTPDNYTITRLSDDTEMLSDVKCVNRAGSDYAAEYTSEMQISFDNASNQHFNANSYTYGTGAGGWSAYVAYGPFYVVTIEIIDEAGNVLQPAMIQEVPEGYVPVIAYRSFVNGDPIAADGEYTFVFSKEDESAKLKDLVATAQADYATGNSYNEFATEGLITKASQLSSPYSQNDHGGADGGNLSNGVLIDGSSSTYWHTVWTGGSVPNHTHYLQVAFEEPISGGVQLSMTRRNANNDHITLIGVWASNEADGEYVEIGSVSTPYSSNVETKKGSFVLMQPYQYLRFYIDGTTTGNGYGHMSEFQLYKATSECLNKEKPAVANVLAEAIATAKTVEYATEEDVASLQKALDFYRSNINKNYWAFTDGTTYNNTEEIQTVLAYTRTFNNQNWQALYVPFSLDYEEWCGEFEIAEINNFIEYDDDDNGTFDRTYLVVTMKASGSTVPNYPYLIRAKNTGEHKLVLLDKTLEAAESKSIDCSSMAYTYTFTGTYQKVDDMYTNGYYALSGGNLQKARNDEVALRAQRWYMSVTPRGGKYSTKAQKICVLVDGEDDIEGISELANSGISQSRNVSFDLTGRVVTTANMARGVSIVNGKKLIK